MSDGVELTEVPERFERWLAGRPLAERSRREYARNVRAYCAWLAETPDRDGWQGDPLADRIRWRAITRRATSAATCRSSGARRASTVNLALASLDALYRCLGLGRPQRAPRQARAGRARARWTRPGSGGCCAPRRPRRSVRGRW